MSLLPDRITLRTITERDIDTLMELTGNPDVIKYLPGMIQDRKYTEQWIMGLMPDDHEYMIQHGDTIIGECKSISESIGAAGIYSLG